MMYLPTGEQMREADWHTINKMGMPSLVLMERAALQVVAIMEREKVNLSKILVVCGAGNNGGDGYAIARLLFLKGYNVRVFFAGRESSRSAENLVQKNIAENYGVPMLSNLENCEYSVIVDAVFGTGLKREVQGTYRDVLQQMNRMDGVKVAVDTPSGVNDTTGEIMGIAFQADLTVAIAFIKRGLALYPGAEYAGNLFVADIGITSESLPKTEHLTYTYEREDLKRILPMRKQNSHKGTYGKVLLIVGSKGMSGAAYLSAKAAYAVGAGLVQIYTAEENRVVLQQLLPEAIITTYEKFEEDVLNRLLHWADVVGIGCGLGKSETAVQLLAYTLQKCRIPCIIDADGLNILSEHMEWLTDSRPERILTPHMKEMTRLLSCEMQELTKDRYQILTRFAEQFHTVTVLKDARTFIASKDEEVYLNLTGNAAMAKGSSGDVLAGMITGLAAQHLTGYEAACIGVYLHGLAGDSARDKKGDYSVLASDIIDGISDVLREI